MIYPRSSKVRLDNGLTKQEMRQRLMLTFNTPFYPEILVASMIMAESVDLHLNYRHVIQHDLCWNPIISIAMWIYLDDGSSTEAHIYVLRMS